MNYTPQEQEQLEQEQHNDMRRARAETLNMLTELAVLIDWLTPRDLDQSRQHLRAHEIIAKFSAGLWEG